MNIKSLQKKPGNQGFSLIELLVVIGIVGVLGMWVGPKLIRRIGDAEIQETKTQIQSLETALKMYKVDNGNYPTTGQGLQALVQKPDTTPQPRKWRKDGYLDSKKVPTDAWKNNYIYISPGVHGPYDITSYGKDGAPGGEDEDKDINSWELK